MRAQQTPPAHHMAQIKASPDLIPVAGSLLIIDWNPTGVLTPCCPSFSLKLAVSNLRNTNFPPPPVNSKLIISVGDFALKTYLLVLRIIYLLYFLLDKINFFFFKKRGHLNFVEAVFIERRRGRNTKCPCEENTRPADPVQVFQSYCVHSGKHGSFVAAFTVWVESFASNKGLSDTFHTWR